MFKYAQVEAAIAELHGLPPSALKTFRARIRNFQRLGIVPSSPGKGQKISYTPEMIAGWAICMELAEVGLPPVHIKTIMENFGFSIIAHFRMLTLKGEDHVMIVRGDFLTGQITDGAKIGYYANIAPVTKLHEVLAASDGVYDRCVLFNFSALKRNLGSVLGIDWGTHEWEKPEAGWYYKLSADHYTATSQTLRA